MVQRQSQFGHPFASPQLGYEIRAIEQERVGHQRDHCDIHRTTIGRPMGDHADAVGTHRAGWRAPMSIRWQDLPVYRAPVLPSMSRRALAWQAICGLNAVAALLLAIAIRRGWPDVIDGVQTYWLASAIVFCAVGAWWSVGRTRNLHLLEGRVPTVARAVRAWVWPPLWALLATFTVLRLDPTQPVDIRPGVVVVVFLFCAWRPVALLRRIFTSLSRLRFDELIASLAAIQIVTWLVLWWHAVEVDADETSDVGGAFQGVAAAASLAFAACTFLIRAIDTATTRAQHHRVLALQTREEHRYVRSLGLNPFKSHVFDEIVRAKLTRERHRREAAGDDELDPHFAPTAGAISRSLVAARSHPRWERVSGAVERLRRTRRRAAERLATMSDAVEQRTAPSVIDDGTTLPRTSSDVWAESSRRQPADIGDTGDDMPSFDVAPPLGLTADDAPTAPTVPTVNDSTLPDTGDPAATAPRQDDTGTSELPRLPDAPRHDASTPADDVVAAPEPDAVREPDAPVDVVDDDDEGPDETIPPPRLAALESARFILLAGLVALALSFDWGVVLALDLSEPIRGGAISARDLVRLDRGRDVVNIVLALTLPLQAVWARFASVWAQRAGCTTARPRLCGWLAVVSLLSGTTALLGIVSDAAPAAVVVLLLLATTSAWMSIMSVTPVALWAESSATNCRIWATGQFVVTIVHIATGGTGDVDAGTAIEWLAFLGVALGLITAVSAVVTGVLALDVEDTIRASKRSALWVQERRHPGSTMLGRTADDPVAEPDADDSDVAASDVAAPEADVVDESEADDAEVDAVDVVAEPEREADVAAEIDEPDDETDETDEAVEVAGRVQRAESGVDVESEVEVEVGVDPITDTDVLDPDEPDPDDDLDDDLMLIDGLALIDDPVDPDASEPDDEPRLGDETENQVETETENETETETETETDSAPPTRTGQHDDRSASVVQRLLRPIVASPRIPRFAMGTALLLVVFGSLWVTLESVVLTPAPDADALAAGDVAEIGRARSWTDAIVTVALPLQVLWVVVASARAHFGRPADRRHDHLFRLLAATVGLAAIDVVLQFAIDAPPVLSQVVLAAMFVTTWLAIRFVRTEVAPYQSHAPLVRGWVVGLAALGVLAVAARTGEVTSSTSSDVLAWLWSAHTAVAAIVTFTAILGSRELSETFETPRRDRRATGTRPDEPVDQPATD
jgi:hypothetical protein